MSPLLIKLLPVILDKAWDLLSRLLSYIIEQPSRSDKPMQGDSAMLIPGRHHLTVVIAVTVTYNNSGGAQCGH